MAGCRLSSVPRAAKRPVPGPIMGVFPRGIFWGAWGIGKEEDKTSGGMCDPILTEFRGPKAEFRPFPLWEGEFPTTTPKPITKPFYIAQHKPKAFG